MSVNLKHSRWYCKVKNNREYQKIKLICDFYSLRSQVPEEIENSEHTIYNGYSYMAIEPSDNTIFNESFKSKFIEISLDYILNYDAPKED